MKESACQCRTHKRHEFSPWVRKIPWRRKRRPTPVFLPGKSCGQRSLVGYSPWSCRGLDKTEQLSVRVHIHTHTHTHTHTGRNQPANGSSAWEIYFAEEGQGLALRSNKPMTCIFVLFAFRTPVFHIRAWHLDATSYIGKMGGRRKSKQTPESVLTS